MKLFKKKAQNKIFQQTIFYFYFPLPNKKIMRKPLLICFLFLSAMSWSQTAENYFDQAIKKSNAGNPKAAIADYDKAIKLKPTFDNAYLNRSMEKIKLNDLKGALDDVNKTLEIQDDNMYAYTTRANIYYKLKDYKAALKDCDVTIKNNAADYLTYNLRGLTNVHLNDSKSACQDFKKAAQMGSQSAVKNLKTFCK